MRIVLVSITTALLSACASSGPATTRTEATIIPTAMGPYVQVGDPAENVTGEIKRSANEVWDLLPLRQRRKHSGLSNTLARAVQH